MSENEVNEEGAAGDVAPGAPHRRPRARAKARARSRRSVAVVAAVAGAIVVVGLLWWSWQAEATRTVTALGAQYSTNLQLEESGGLIYVTIPVNTDAASARLNLVGAGDAAAASADDNAKIREFLDSLDTLVPGEHVLSLSTTNLHFIVDGMADAE